MYISLYPLQLLLALLSWLDLPLMAKRRGGGGRMVAATNHMAVNGEGIENPLPHRDPHHVAIMSDCSTGGKFLSMPTSSFSL